MIIHLCVYILSEVAYELTTETVWPIKTTIFTFWPFTEKLVDP